MAIEEVKVVSGGKKSPVRPSEKETVKDWNWLKNGIILALIAVALMGNFYVLSRWVNLSWRGAILWTAFLSPFVSAATYYLGLSLTNKKEGVNENLSKGLSLLLILAIAVASIYYIKTPTPQKDSAISHDASLTPAIEDWKIDSQGNLVPISDDATRALFLKRVGEPTPWIIIPEDNRVFHFFSLKAIIVEEKGGEKRTVGAQDSYDMGVKSHKRQIRLISVEEDTQISITIKKKKE